VNATDRDIVVLAALLHDIGKFYQRTGRPADEWGVMPFDTADTGPAGAHSRWSAAFITRYVPEPWRGAGWIALTHHRPQDAAARLVQEADHLAARFDREKRPQKERGDITQDRLEALLEQVSLADAGPGATLKIRRFGMPLQAFSARREALFPLRVPALTDLRAEYAALWDAFLVEAEAAGRIFVGLDASVAEYITTMAALLDKYAWCVPSATYVDYPNVALSDHLRATAAVAACLYATDGSPRFRLVMGDVNGIQRFLYDVADPAEVREGAARRLRGKSFFLHLLTRTVAESVLAAGHLYDPNLLWATGGHFAILAPDLEAIMRPVHEAASAAEAWLWDDSHGSLGLTVASVPADEENLADFGNLLEKARHALLEARARPQSFLFQCPEKWRGKPPDAVCKACGRDSQAGMEVENGKCRHCREFEAIGRVLPRTRVLIDLGENTLAGAKSLCCLGTTWWLSERLVAPTGSLRLVALVNARNPETEFLPPQGPGTCAYRFEVTPTQVPMEAGDRGTVVEFSDLADRAPASYLGVLRMDVDNLGAIMSRGLPRSDRTLSKVAALSRTVAWFFGAYLDTIADRHDLYVTYAGGDDLFIVGPWDGILEAAVEVRNAFSVYACDNPDVHLSGALWLCKGKFPVGRAAGYAGDRLDEMAKTRRQPQLAHDTDKNALAVFETKVPWDVLVRLKGLADDALIPAVRDGRLARAFIYFLVNLYRHYIQSPPGGGGGVSLQWVPKLRYALTRNVKDQALAARVWAEVPALQHYLGVLASYVSLKTRDVGSERR
jgi:CRISPR-associated protein Csm1